MINKIKKRGTVSFICSRGLQLPNQSNIRVKPTHERERLHFTLDWFEIVEVSRTRIKANAFLYVLKCTFYAIGRKFKFHYQKYKNIYVVQKNVCEKRDFNY